MFIFLKFLVFRIILFFGFFILSYYSLSSSPDYLNYINHISLESLGSLLLRAPLYTLFALYFYNSNIDLPFILWIINWVLLFIFIVRAEPRFSLLFLFFYFAIFGHLWHTVQLRQGIAIASILVFQNLKVNKWIKWILLTLLAYSWHRVYIYFLDRNIQIKLRIWFTIVIIVHILTLPYHRLNTFNYFTLFIFYYFILVLYTTNIVSLRLMMSVLVYYIFGMFDPTIASRSLELSLFFVLYDSRSSSIFKYLTIPSILLIYFVWNG